MAQKILKIGSSAGMTLSRSALETLGIGIGADIVVHEDRLSNSVTILPKNALVSTDVEIMKIGADILRRYRADFQSLANR